MNRGLATAKVIIIHGGQIVMDQGIAVKAFESGTRSRGCLGVPAKQGCALLHQEGPQALAAVQRAVAHGRQKMLRTHNFVFQHPVVEKAGKQAFHIGCTLAQVLVKLGGVDRLHAGSLA